jgi:hypothetical protein
MNMRVLTCALADDRVVGAKADRQPAFRRRKELNREQICALVERPTRLEERCIGIGGIDGAQNGWRSAAAQSVRAAAQASAPSSRAARNCGANQTVLDRGRVLTGALCPARHGLQNA